MAKDGLKLPENKSGIDKRFKSQKFLMIGASGIGKSGFWAQDPNAFFIEAEAGLNAYSLFKLPARTIQDVRQIYGLLKEKAEKGEFPYSVVVVDTIDKIVEYITEEVLNEARQFYTKKAGDIHTLFDIPEGGGWDRCRIKMKMLLNAFEKLPCATALIGHLENKTIRPKNQKEFSKDTISIGGKLGGDILAWADHTLNIQGIMQGENLIRTIFTKPTESRECKSRGGMLPEIINWVEDDKKNYEEFRKLFS